MLVLVDLQLVRSPAASYVTICFLAETGYGDIMLFRGLCADLPLLDGVLERYELIGLVLLGVKISSITSHVLRMLRLRFAEANSDAVPLF